jgi:biotin carboxyl carrier protein
MSPETGEHLDVAERVVVSPQAGLLRVDERVCSVVRAGQTIATVENSGSSIPVTSPFDGFLMGLIPRPGQRIRRGQPVAWLRGFGS